MNRRPHPYFPRNWKLRHTFKDKENDLRRVHSITTYNISKASPVTKPMSDPALVLSSPNTRSAVMSSSVAATSLKRPQTCRCVLASDLADGLAAPTHRIQLRSTSAMIASWYASSLCSVLSLSSGPPCVLSGAPAQAWEDHAVQIICVFQEGTVLGGMEWVQQCMGT